MTSPNGGSDAAAIIAAAREAAVPVPVDLERIQSYVLPEGMTIETLDPVAEGWAAGPRRKTGTVVMTDGVSLARYINDHGGPGTSIYASTALAPTPLVMAVLNGHEPQGGPAGYSDHHAAYAARWTDEWERWVRSNAHGRWVGQSAFADLIDDSTDIITVVGDSPSAADMAELAATLHVTEKAELTSTADGHRLEWNVTQQARASKDRGATDVPSVFYLALRPFETADIFDDEGQLVEPPRWATKVRLHWKKDGTSVAWKWAVSNAETALRLAWREIRTQITDDTGRDLFAGSPPDAIRRV